VYLMHHDIMCCCQNVMVDGKTKPLISVTAEKRLRGNRKVHNLHCTILHDFVIGAKRHIFGHHSSDGTDCGMGRTLLLLVGEAPALRDPASGFHIGIFLQILRNKEMHCHQFTVFKRVAPASTNALSIAAGAEIMSQT
jgi:hypothetical protein